MGSLAPRGAGPFLTGGKVKKTKARKAVKRGRTTLYGAVGKAMRSFGLSHPSKLVPGTEQGVRQFHDGTEYMCGRDAAGNHVEVPYKATLPFLPTNIG
jgi:hypothetical protein